MDSGRLLGGAYGCARPGAKPYVGPIRRYQTALDPGPTDPHRRFARASTWATAGT